jgi:hypothetical protein
VDVPATRYDSAIERLRDAALPDRPAPPELEPYLDKVRRNASTIGDGDVEAAVAAAASEDVVFEQTVAVAVAAGLERRAAGLGALP